MDLYENYLNSAKKYLCEDEDDFDLDDVPVIFQFKSGFIKINTQKLRSN